MIGVGLVLTLVVIVVVVELVLLLVVGLVLVFVWVVVLRVYVLRVYVFYDMVIILLILLVPDDPDPVFLTFDELLILFAPLLTVELEFDDGVVVFLGNVLFGDNVKTGELGTIVLLVVEFVLVVGAVGLLFILAGGSASFLAYL